MLVERTILISFRESLDVNCENFDGKAAESELGGSSGGLLRSQQEHLL